MPDPGFSPEAIAELRSKWKGYADRLREGDGGGSLVGAAYIIANTAVADIPTLLADLEAKDGEVERLRGAILDIDAHASALGEDAEGFVRGGYVVSVGAMHRALGVVGHTAYTRAECAVWMELEHGSACAGCVQMQEIALSAVAALAPSTPKGDGDGA